MAKGVLYIMTTVVDGLIKIGKTGTSNYESRMYSLERNGYANVTGLKRRFAIEVDDYDEKEELLDTIFEKSNVPGTELFALDVNLVIQLLSSFEGKVVFPIDERKERIFDEATEKIVKETDEKRSRFRFSEVGIPVGEELTFINDKKIKVKVADDTHITYKGEIWSMSRLARFLLKRQSTVQGTLHFAYKGKRLTDLRDEVENT